MLAPYPDLWPIRRRKPRRPSLWQSLVLAAVLSLTGCPRRFSAAATPTVTSSDAKANEQFDKAQRLYQAKDLERAEQAFSRFVAAHPDDPLASLARVYLAQIVAERGKLTQARQLLDQTIAGKVPESVTELARHQLGLVLVRLGEHRRGRELLLPFVDTADDDTLPGVLAALARASEGLGRPVEALRYYARLHEQTDRPTEKVFARAALERLIQGQLRQAQLESALQQAAPGSLLRALLAQRLIALATRAGDLPRAERLRRETADARQRHQVHERAATTTRRRTVGLLLPFSGRYRGAARRALAGALAASGAFDRTPSTPPLVLLIRDSAADASAAARDLVERERVAALVGTLDPRAAQGVGDLASRQGVPFLSLSTAPAAPDQTTTLRLLPDNAQRARALARRATRPGARVALVAPRNGYGKQMIESLAAQVRDSGGVVAVRQTYDPQTRSFTALASELARARFDRLIVADSAQRLGLLAPALALAGLWPAPPGKTAPKGRPIQLFATAEGLSDRLLISAGRYLQGAILAPGYYAADGAPPSRSMGLFRAAHGRAPGLMEAFAFDAMAIVRQLAAPDGPHGALLAALHQGAFDGLTGRVRFSPDGRRADPPLLYRVSGERIERLPAP